MATREDVYCKFGLAAEAGQLFEAELGTLLLGARALKDGWHITPDLKAGRKLLDEIDRHTLGRLLGRVKTMVEFDESMDAGFVSALKSRNRLIHGFFELHNFQIQTDEGRDSMMIDLEALHTELFDAWQAASAMTSALTKVLIEQQKNDPPLAR